MDEPFDFKTGLGYEDVFFKLYAQGTQGTSMGLISSVFGNRKQKFLRQIDTAINQVKHGTYNTLFIMYLDRFDRDFAGSLAAAVTNTLFAEKPVGEEAETFLKENLETVNKEVENLEGEKIIGNLVADAIQIKASMVFSSQQSGTYDKNFGKSYEILRKIGFLKKPENVSPYKVFITKADKYFMKSLKAVKYL